MRERKHGRRSVESDILSTTSRIWKSLSKQLSEKANAVLSKDNMRREEVDETQIRVIAKLPQVARNIIYAGFYLSKGKYDFTKLCGDIYDIDFGGKRDIVSVNLLAKCSTKYAAVNMVNDSCIELFVDLETLFGEQVDVSAKHLRTFIKRNWRAVKRMTTDRQYINYYLYITYYLAHELTHTYQKMSGQRLSGKERRYERISEFEETSQNKLAREIEHVLYLMELPEVEARIAQSFKEKKSTRGSLLKIFANSNGDDFHCAFDEEGLFFSELLKMFMVGVGVEKSCVFNKMKWYKGEVSFINYYKEARKHKKELLDIYNGLLSSYFLLNRKKLLKGEHTYKETVDNCRKLLLREDLSLLEKGKSLVSLLKKAAKTL